MKSEEQNKKTARDCLVQFRPGAELGQHLEDLAKDLDIDINTVARNLLRVYCTGFSVLLYYRMQEYCNVAGIGFASLCERIAGVVSAENFRRHKQKEEPCTNSESEELITEFLDYKIEESKKDIRN